MSWPDFYAPVQRRLADPSHYRLPRGFELGFADPKTDEELAINGLVYQYRQAQVRRRETEMFAQKRRLAGAERKLVVKESKASATSKRIASTEVQQAVRKVLLP